MKLRALATPILLTLLVGLVPAVARAGDGPNVLRRIDVREGEHETVIAIEGSTTPTFSVFKLEDPVRLFVDIANADVRDVDRTLEIDNGVLDQVGVLQFHNDSTLIGRVIVGFRRPAAYDVRARGNTVEVVIDASERTPRGPDLSSARRELDTVSRALTEQKQALEALKAAREREETLSQQARDSRLAEEKLRSSLEEARRKAEELTAQAELKHATLLKETELAEKAREKAEEQKKALETAAQREQEKLDALALGKQRMEEATAAAAKARTLEEERTKALAEAGRLEAERVDALRQARHAEEEQGEALRAARTREAALKTQLAAAGQRLTAATTKVTEEHAAAQALRAQAAAASDVAQALRLKHEAETREAAALQERTEAAQEKQALEEELSDASARSAERERAQTTTLASEMEDLRARARAHEEAAARAQQAGVEHEVAERLASELRQGQAEASSIAQEKDAQAAEARALAAQLQQQSEQLAALSRQQLSERQRLAELASTRSDEEAEVRRLEADRSEQERVISGLTAEQEKKHAESEALAGSLSTQRTEVERLQQQAASARSDLHRLEEQRARQEREVAQLQRELEKLRGRKAAAMGGDVRRLTDDLATRERELSELRTRYAAEVEGAKAAMVERRSPDTDRAAAAEQALQKKEEELTQLATRLSGSEDQVRALQEKLRAAGAEDAEVASARARLHESEQKLAELTARFGAPADGDSAPLQRLQRFLEEQARTIAALQQRADSAEARATALEAGTRTPPPARTAAAPAAAAPRGDRLQQFLAEQDAAMTALHQRHEGGAPADASLARIGDVVFRETDDSSNVVVTVNGHVRHEMLQAAPDRLVLILHGAEISPALERRLDTSEFEGPVRMVSSYRDPSDPRAVRVEVQLDAPVSQTVRDEDGRLVWAFEAEASARDAALEHVGEAPSIRGESGGRPDIVVAPAARVGYGYHPDRIGAGSPEPGAVPTEEAPTGAAVSTGGGDAGGGAFLKPVQRKKERKYTGKRINLTIKDADIRDVLTFLAKEGRVNIIAAEGVSGTVSFHLENIPWDLALDMILRAKGLDYVKEHGIYRVAPTAVIQKEFELELDKRRKITEMKQLVVKLIPVNYGKAADLAERGREILSPKGSIGVDDRTNTLIVKDIEDHVAAIEDLIRRLDTQTPQVLIEARIVEATRSYSQEIGIQWGGNFGMSPVFGNQTGLAFPSTVGIAGGADDTTAPTSGLFSGSRPNFAVNLPAAVGNGAGGALGITLGSIGGAGNLSLRLSAAEQDGTVKIISAPKISTLDNRQATIQQGVSIPISVVSAQGVNTQFFNAELQLTVLPHVTPDGNIAMKIDITKNEPDFSRAGANGNPSIQKKEAHTEILLKDGDTSVIGGIFTRTESESFTEVPFLSKIPVLGWLFKKRTQQDDRSELLIFITPRIVNREVPVSGE